MKEKRGQETSPCEQIGNGKSRMPMLNYVRGAAFVINDPYHLVYFAYDAKVMGDVEPCVDSIKNVLKSIKWRL